MPSGFVDSVIFNTFLCNVHAPNLVCSSRRWVCLNRAEIFRRRSVRASIICPFACTIRNEEPFLSQLRMNESIYGPMWLPSCLLFCDLRYEFFSVLIDCQFYLFSVHCKDRGSSSLNSGFKRTCLVSSYVPTMWYLLLCNFHTSFLTRSSTQRACFERWIVRISSILSSRLVDSAWRSFLCTTAEEFSKYGSIWTRSRFLSSVICSLIRMHVDIALTELATCWCLAILTFGCMPIFTLGSFLAMSFPDMNVCWIVLFSGSACICGRCRMFSFSFALRLSSRRASSRRRTISSMLSCFFPDRAWNCTNLLRHTGPLWCLAHSLRRLFNVTPFPVPMSFAFPFCGCSWKRFLLHAVSGIKMKLFDLLFHKPLNHFFEALVIVRFASH